MSDKPVTMQDGVGRVELPNDPAKLKRIIEIERECSVKRNLCPDHRDKQAFQPCVVCRAEHAEKMRDLTLAENSRLKDELDREREARQVAEAEAKGIRLYLSGEQVGVSTGICGSTTYGYGNLDPNGYWQYPVPDWFRERIDRLRALVELAFKEAYTYTSPRPWLASNARKALEAR